MSQEPLDILSNAETTWKDATAKILGSSSSSHENLTRTLSSKTQFKDAADEERILRGMKTLGLFSDEKITPRGKPLDTLCAILEQKLQYGPGERDLVFLQHLFEVSQLLSLFSMTMITLLCRLSMQTAVKSIGRRLWSSMVRPRKEDGRLWRDLLVYRVVSFLMAVHTSVFVSPADIRAHSGGGSPSNGRYDIGEGNTGTDEVSGLNVEAFD